MNTKKECIIKVLLYDLKELIIGLIVSILLMLIISLFIYDIGFIVSSVFGLEKHLLYDDGQTVYHGYMLIGLGLGIIGVFLLLIYEMLKGIIRYIKDLRYRCIK